jgi:ankyrin repeat protein
MSIRYFLMITRALLLIFCAIQVTRLNPANGGAVATTTKINQLTEKTKTTIIKMLFSPEINTVTTALDIIDKQYSESKYELINSKNTAGIPSLHNAVNNKNKTIIDLLLNHGADPSVQASDKTSSLHLASGKSDREIAELLINHYKNNNNPEQLKSFINQQGSDRVTALHYAVTNKNKTIIDLLLNHGADPSIRDSDGINSLHIASCKSDREIAQLLINHYKKNNNPEQLKSFINQQNSAGVTALHYAVSNKNIDVIDLLLNHWADPSIRDSHEISSLHETSSKNDTKIAQQLIKHYEKNNSREELKLFINQQNSAGVTALHNAVNNKNTKIIHLLLNHDGDPSVQASDGTSSLHLASHVASSKSDTEIAQLLINHYKNNNSTEQLNLFINQQNSAGVTALHYAVINKNKTIIDLLLNHGADPSVRDSHGTSSLHLASSASDTEIPQLLINHYKNNNSPEQLKLFINQQDSAGVTALDNAVKNKNKIIIDLLLNCGVDKATIRTYADSPDLGNKIKRIFSRHLAQKAPEANDNSAKDPTTSGKIASNSTKLSDPLSVKIETLSLGSELKSAEEDNQDLYDGKDSYNGDSSDSEDTDTASAKASASSSKSPASSASSIENSNNVLYLDKNRTKEIKISVIEDASDNKILFMGDTQAHAQSIARIDADEEKNRYMYFKDKNRLTKEFISFDNRVAKFLTANIREAKEDMLMGTEEEIRNVIAHALTMELVIDVLLRGSTYLQVCTEKNKTKLRLLVVASIHYEENSTRSQKFITLCFGLTESGIVTESYHCCIQEKHPQEIKNGNGLNKFLLQPIEGQAKINKQNSTLKIALKEFSNKRNTILNKLKNTIK